MGDGPDAGGLGAQSITKKVLTKHGEKNIAITPPRPVLAMATGSCIYNVGHCSWPYGGLRRFDCAPLAPRGRGLAPPRARRGYAGGTMRTTTTLMLSQLPRSKASVTRACAARSAIVCDTSVTRSFVAESTRKHSCTMLTASSSLKTSQSPSHAKMKK